MSAKKLLKLYENKGWEALASHPELPLQSKSLMLLAIENEQLALAHHIFSRATPLDAMNASVFTACCERGYWDLVNMLVGTVPPTDAFAHRFMANSALKYQKFDVVHNVIKHVEDKNFIAYIVLQECAKKHHDELFEQLIEHITPHEQEDLCEMFLWRSPVYAEKMINHISDLADRMMGQDVGNSEGRANLQAIAAKRQRGILLQGLPDKNCSVAKKI